MSSIDLLINICLRTFLFQIIAFSSQFLQLLLFAKNFLIWKLKIKMVSKFLVVDFLTSFFNLNQ